jgi:P2-related tail formation protein
VYQGQNQPEAKDNHDLWPVQPEEQQKRDRNQCGPVIEDHHGTLVAVTDILELVVQVLSVGSKR